jgi:hypothetical protein
LVDSEVEVFLHLDIVLVLYEMGLEVDTEFAAELVAKFSAMSAAELAGPHPHCPASLQS